MDLNDRDYLQRQLIKLGYMMGDGLHHEPGSAWISIEYEKIAKHLYPDMFPKNDNTIRDRSVSKWCESHTCPKCKGALRQTRSGSFRVICNECGSKFQLKAK